MIIFPRGLKWIYEASKEDVSGVIYFADDDNTYNQRLFSLIRWGVERNYYEKHLGTLKGCPSSQSALSASSVCQALSSRWEQGLSGSMWWTAGTTRQDCASSCSSDLSNSRYDAWDAGRKFKLDMAGFSVSVALYRNRSQGSPIMMPPKRGHEEDEFLKLMNVELAELEVISPNEVLVWHTKTVDSPKPRDPGPKYKGTNVALLWTEV